MRRRDFTIGLLLAAAARRCGRRSGQSSTGLRSSSPQVPSPASTTRRVAPWQAFWEELRRLGDVEGQNLTVERYSGEGRPEGFADLAREVVNRNPDVIVAITTPSRRPPARPPTQYRSSGSGADPIQGTRDEPGAPGRQHYRCHRLWGDEIYGKRLQILKEAVPSASKVAFLAMRTAWEGDRRQQFRETGRRLEISLIGMPLQESTPSEFQRVFAEIAQHRPDAIIVSGTGDLFPYRQLIVELVEKSRLPAMYPWRD